MSEPRFTLREMAAKIADLDGANVEVIFNRIRGAQQRGLFSHVDARGPKGALRFTAQTLYFAAVLVDVVEVFEAEQLAGAARAILHGAGSPQNPAPSMRGDGFNYGGNGIAAAIRGILADAPERWILHLSLIATADGGRRVGGRFVWEGEQAEDDRANEAVSLWLQSRGERVVAELVFPSITDRLAELVRQVEA